MYLVLAILLGFTVHINGPTLEVEGKSVRVAEKGYSLPAREGVPAIPQKSYVFAVPGNQEVVKVRVKSIKTEKLSGRFEISPVPPPAIIATPWIKFEAKPARKDPRIYRSDKFYPENFFTFDGNHRILGINVVSVTIRPYRYNPVTGEVEVLKSLDLEFITEGSSKKRIKRSEWGNYFTLSILRGIVENPEGVTGNFVPITDGMDYLIVTDPGMSSPFDSLARWYRRFGIKAVVRTTDWISSHYSGRDLAEKIRNYARICYQDSGLVALLLGGDVEFVPARVAYAMTCEAGIINDEDSLRADLYFSDLDGSWDENGNGTFGEVADSVDLYPDIIVGRAPVRFTREVQTFVDKVINYEKPMYRDYQNRALFFAEVLWQDPFTDESIGKDMIDSMYVPDYITIEKLYQTLGNENSAAVMAAIDSGVNLMNHDGHGWYTGMGTGEDYLSISDVLSLTNGYRCGILYSIGCWVGAFDMDAISEYFIRNENGGGVAFIGNSRYGWGAPGNPGYGYSDRFDAEFYGMIFERNVINLGAALGLDKVLFIPFSRDENLYRWHQYQVNLLGDPLMPVWRDIPRELQVIAPDTVIAGSEFRVTVSPTLTGWAAITDQDSILDAGEVRGSVILRVPQTVTGEITLGVNIPEYTRLIKRITVIHQGSYVRVDTVFVRDSAYYPDSLITPGESGNLYLVFKNFGNETSSQVNVCITEVNGILSLEPESLTVSVLEPDEEETLRVHYVAGDRTGYAILKFFINGDSTAFSLPVTQPRLEGAATLVSGTLNPGDSGSIEIEVINVSIAPARDVWLIVNSQTPDVFVNDTIFLPEIGPSDSSTCTVGVYVEPTAVSGSIYSLTVTYTASGITDTFLLEGIIGISSYAEDFEGDLNGWTIGSRWSVVERRSHSGAKSLYCGLPGSWHYGNNWNSSVESPEIVVSFDPQLSFWLWFEVATYGSDGFYVEILRGDDVYTLDFIGSGGGLDSSLSFVTNWAEYTYDLNFLNPGDTVRVRFRFVSDREDTAEGFYIDDFLITGKSIVSPVGIGEELKTPFKVLLIRGGFEIAINSYTSNHIKIFDITGRLAKEMKVTGPGVLKVTNLNPGVYFVKYGGKVERAIIIR